MSPINFDKSGIVLWLGCWSGCAWLEAWGRSQSKVGGYKVLVVENRQKRLTWLTLYRKRPLYINYMNSGPGCLLTADNDKMPPWTWRAPPSKYNNTSVRPHSGPLLSSSLQLFFVPLFILILFHIIWFAYLYIKIFTKMYIDKFCCLFFLVNDS